MKFHIDVLTLGRAILLVHYFLRGFFSTEDMHSHPDQLKMQGHLSCIHVIRGDLQESFMAKANARAQCACNARSRQTDSHIRLPT